jgi:GNAT superfamily N-acetyltransferase
MLSPYIHAALAHERHQEFLARAETDRRARQARLHRLRDGTGAARRSPRRWRPAWLRPGPRLLFGHWPRSAVTGWQVRSADDPQAAEIAVTVIDDRQGRGLGTELVAQLCQ